jgi:hypothetical protein
MKRAVVDEYDEIFTEKYIRLLHRAKESFRELRET